MQPQTIIRPFVRFPEWESAPAAFKRMAGRLEAQSEIFRERAAALPAAVDGPWLSRIPWQRYRTDLSHPLSDLWTIRGGGQRNNEFRDPGAELGAFRRVRVDLGAALEAEQSATFLQALRITCANIGEVGGAAEVAFRQTEIGLDPDVDGTQVLFGDWSRVPAQLEALFDQYRQSMLPSTMKAVAAMVMLLNIHPFADGNGRCARALFNVALNSPDKRAEVYVPLRAAQDAAQAGFEIRVREVETNGNWAPLIGYFTTVFAIMAEACAAGGTHAPVPA